MPSTLTNRNIPLPSYKAILRLINTTRHDLHIGYPQEYAREIRQRMEEWRAYYIHAHNDVWGSYDVDNAADDVMRHANRLLGMHGVAGIVSTDTRQYGKDGISYCNAGDPYRPTLLYDSRTRRFSIGTWGDLVETEEDRFAE